MCAHELPGDSLAKDPTARRVLVVEDDDGLNKLAQKVLRRSGFEALGALTGAEAVEVATAAPDVVLLVDHRLPDMLGTDLVHALNELGLHVPFVAMTGHGDEAVAVEMMKLGARDYLVKRADLVDRLPDVLQRVFREVETERRLALARRELLESETRFRRLVEYSPDIVYSHSPRLGGRYYSARVQDVLGYSPELLLKRRFLWFESIHPDDIARVHQALAASREGAPFDLEYRIRTATGEWRWLHDRSMHIREEAGELLIEGLAMDITERKQSEAALRESVDKFQGMFEHSPLGMMLLDAEGVVVNANPAVGCIAGVSSERYIGLRLPDVVTDERQKASLLKGLREGESHAEGPYKSFLTDKALILKSAVSKISSNLFLYVFEDVTELHRMQESMVQNEKMMSVGGLAAGMAHEINNPLSGIMQSVQVVKNRITTDLPANVQIAREVGCELPKIREFLARRKVMDMIDAIAESAGRAAIIVKNMLEFSRQSGSAPTLEDLNVLLDKSLELSSSDYDLKKKYDFRKIKVERDYASDLPAVPCNAGRLEQVFMNILRNAAQAMAGQPPGAAPPRIVLRTRLEGAVARIDIEDNGPGMDLKTKRRIFEPFFTTKPQGEGTGLGLSVSYFIVTSTHRGTIEVESQPGLGTTFIIRLPVNPGVPGSNATRAH